MGDITKRRDQATLRRSIKDIDREIEKRVNTIVSVEAETEKIAAEVAKLREEHCPNGSLRILGQEVDAMEAHYNQVLKVKEIHEGLGKWMPEMVSQLQILGGSLSQGLVAAQHALVTAQGGDQSKIDEATRNLEDDQIKVEEMVKGVKDLLKALNPATNAVGNQTEPSIEGAMTATKGAVPRQGTADLNTSTPSHIRPPRDSNPNRTGYQDTMRGPSKQAQPSKKRLREE
ncbi:hypothetical protein BST61_g6226 [Cercospora zeina]